MRGVLILIILAFISCSTKRNSEQPNADSLDDESVSSGDYGELKSEGDSLLIPAFEIQVDLDNTATKKLADQKETIIVSIDLFGEPEKGVTKNVNEMGELYLASPRFELNQPGVAKFENVKISKQGYESLADKDFTVLVNVFSGRKSSSDNLLNCDILQEPFSKVKGTKQTLKGKLIYE